MKIKQVDIDKIIPYDRNPRKNDSAVAKVAGSIKEFGWQQPIVVDSEMVVIAGHTRLLAARQLEMKKVPIQVAEDLTPNQVKAYRLADNRVSEEAEWDHDLLALEIGDLENKIDLSLTGFDEVEIASLLAADIDQQLANEDDVPLLDESPIAKLSDIWLMGNHRLVCGDSTNADDVAKCLNGVEPHLMVTDPPYGVNYDPNWRNEVERKNALTKQGEVYGARAIGKVANDDRSDWREAWELFKGDVAYVWHGGLHSTTVAESLIACGFELRTQIIWVKQHFVFGRGHYHWQHEPCWYVVRNGGHWSGDRTQTSVWHIQNNNPLGGSKEKQTGHGTQKPVECMRRPIENNSSRGQAIYEPFNGSGTTLIAAEATGRVCHALELDPRYVDATIKRWQTLTGKQAIRESDGKKYDALIKKTKAA